MLRAVGLDDTMLGVNQPRWSVAAPPVPGFALEGGGAVPLGSSKRRPDKVA